MHSFRSLPRVLISLKSGFSNCEFRCCKKRRGGGGAPSIVEPNNLSLTKQPYSERQVVRDDGDTRRNDG